MVPRTAAVTNSCSPRPSIGVRPSRARRAFRKGRAISRQRKRLGRSRQRSHRVDIRHRAGKRTHGLALPCGRPGGCRHDGHRRRRAFCRRIHGLFDAFDASSGKILYQFQTGAPMAGGVITYSVDGQQLVAAVSGNHSIAALGGTEPVWSTCSHSASPRTKRLVRHPDTQITRGRSGSR